MPLATRIQLFSSARMVTVVISYSTVTILVKEVEETIDELLGRLDEFCGITDAIRSDTSEILDETIPLIKDKVVEMNHVYAKVDKLEAFVKMVAHHVSFLEEQVLEAEKSHGTFLNTVCNLFPCVTISSFKNQPMEASVAEEVQFSFCRSRTNLNCIKRIMNIQSG
nr:PREDICTED: breast carcinoma-amplified sequence 4 [Opisthocomus hoazin]